MHACCLWLTGLGSPGDLNIKVTAMSVLLQNL